MPFNLVPNEFSEGDDDSVIDKVRSGVSCKHLPVIKSLIADDIRLTIYNKEQQYSHKFNNIQSYLVYQIT